MVNFYLNSNLIDFIMTLVFQQGGNGGSDLRLVHPGVVHVAASVRLFEGVSGVNRNASVWVVQRDVSRQVFIPLADLLQLGVENPPRGCSHVQRVLASLNVVEVLHYGR